MKNNERPKNPNSLGGSRHTLNMSPATFEYILQNFEVQWKCDHHSQEMCAGEAAQAKTGLQNICNSDQNLIQLVHLNWTCTWFCKELLEIWGK